MFRYVPFDQIEKNKWNGTVHYAPNGNVFGYHWYLKAVYKKWDAIVEGDYQSVLPILPKSKLGIYKLTPQLGPYSVNPLNANRTSVMMKLMKEHATNGLYPINERCHAKPYHRDDDILLPIQKLDMIDSYDSIQNSYTEEGKQEMLDAQSGELNYSASIKPEIIVDHLPKNNEVNNAYLRIMYNALHRGIGWSQAITDKTTGKYVAISFFVVSHNVVHEIISLPNTKDMYRNLLYDMSLKNSAGKPSTLATYLTSPSNTKLGFTTDNNRLIKLNPIRFEKVKSVLNLPI